MPEHEPDEFDAVPAGSAHRGAYRAAPVEGKESARGTLLMVAAGVLALVLGAIMFVVAPRNAAPAAGGLAGALSSSSSASSSAQADDSPGESASGEATEESSAEAAATADPSVSVAVFNAVQTQGAAEQAAATLAQEGWTVTEVANWGGAVVEGSTVFYQEGTEDQARAAAQALGIQDVQESADYSTQLVVVIAQ